MAPSPQVVPRGRALWLEWPLVSGYGSMSFGIRVGASAAITQPLQMPPTADSLSPSAMRISIRSSEPQTGHRVDGVGLMPLLTIGISHLCGMPGSHVY